jgi:hypothetical protein
MDLDDISSICHRPQPVADGLRDRLRSAMGFRPADTLEYARQAWRWFFGEGGPRHRRIAFYAGAPLAVAAFLVLPVGMLMTNQINDDTAFTAPQEFEIPNGSHAVAMAEALVDREINHTSWVSNDPAFLPGAYLSRMPAFQKGVIYGVARFTQKLQDVLGRARGSSDMDPDLVAALGRINYAPDVWVYDASVSWWKPQTTSVDQYEFALSPPVTPSTTSAATIYCRC